MKIYGIDTLEINIKIEKYEECFGNFLDYLENLKREAQSQYEDVCLLLTNINFVVRPKGQGFYSYKLECEDFHICFMRQENRNTAPIHVRFLSNFLWQHNYQNAYLLFIDWFEQTFEIKITEIQISRLDLCCDSDEICFSPKDNKKFVTRAKKKEILNVDSENYNGKHFSGFTIGKGSPLMCRIYDKTLEIQKSQKTWFYELWKQQGWTNKTVWRIEFQARRKVLKELGIESLYDLDTKIETLWAYYTQNWCIMRQPQKDSNISRWKTTKVWKKIQKICINYETTPLSRQVMKQGNEDVLINSCYGSMTSLAAIKGFNTASETFLYVIDTKKKQQEKSGDSSFLEKVKHKSNRYFH